MRGNSSWFKQSREADRSLHLSNGKASHAALKLKSVKRSIKYRQHENGEHTLNSLTTPCSVGGMRPQYTGMYALQTHAYLTTERIYETSFVRENYPQILQLGYTVIEYWCCTVKSHISSSHNAMIWQNACKTCITLKPTYCVFDSATVMFT